MADEREAVARTQNPVDQHERADGEREREPVAEDVARRGAAHMEQFADEIEAEHRTRDVGRQRGAGAAAKLLDLGEHQPADLGDDPGADGEIGAAQTEHDQRRRNGDEAGDDAGEDDREDGIDAGDQGKGEQRIGADADESLLADRNQAGTAGQQIPQLRQRQHGEDVKQFLQQRAAAKAGKASSKTMPGTASSR